LAILEFINVLDWDRPFFKKLAKNDTADAAGHQGGMVIPKELRPFFPGLTGITTSDAPTVEAKISAELYEGPLFLGRVIARYQFQTWGNTRPPESRLTDNLGRLRNRAKEDDVLVIQRSRISLSVFRLILIRGDSAAYEEVDALTHGQRWGVIGPEQPMSEDDLIAAVAREQAAEVAPFVMIEPAPTIIVSKTVRIARSLAFRLRLVQIYWSATIRFAGNCRQG
jgi:putative restriction endonuclease